MRVSGAGRAGRCDPMKDIVENRRRLPAGRKLALLREVARENGWIWTLTFVVYYCATTLGDAAYRRMQARARRKGLPGLSGRAVNRQIWESWDWGARGEEWTLSEEWKGAVIAGILERLTPAGCDVLEIGCGGGRWTEHLVARAGRLTGVDIAESCVRLCEGRFGGGERARFFQTDGRSLVGVADASIDRVWSFDVFVHIDADDAAGYIGELRRVLRGGGIAVIHHGKDPSLGGWRSNLTQERFTALAREGGFEILEQFDRFDHGGRTHEVGRYGDIVTVLRWHGETGA